LRPPPKPDIKDLPKLACLGLPKAAIQAECSTPGL
jgi:hypothetical protein